MPRPKKIENETVNETTPMEENAADTTEENTAAAPVQTQEAEAPSEKEQEVQTVDVAALLAKVDAMQKEMEALKAAKASNLDGVVKLVYINPVSERNEVNLGDFGVLRGSTGCLEVPRRDFGGKFMTSTVQYLLRTKRLMVTEGLTKAEKERYKLDYPDDAVMSERTFDHLLNMTTDELEKLFVKLCPEHQWFVARRFISAYEKGDNRINRDKVERLNEISKQTDPEGMFKPVLLAMNKV